MEKLNPLQEQTLLAVEKAIVERFLKTGKVILDSGATIVAHLEHETLPNSSKIVICNTEVIRISEELSELAKALAQIIFLAEATPQNNEVKS